MKKNILFITLLILLTAASTLIIFNDNMTINSLRKELAKRLDKKNNTNERIAKLEKENNSLKRQITSKKVQLFQKDSQIIRKDYYLNKISLTTI